MNRKGAMAQRVLFLGVMLGAVLLVACGQPSTTDPTATAADIAATATQPPTAGPTPEPSVTPIGLEGRLIYTLGQKGMNQYDFATGTESVLLPALENSLMISADVSPDGSLLAIAYAPPPTDDPTEYAYTNLYVMPSDGSAEPTLIFDAPKGELISWPEWSPDGEYIYYSHVLPVGNAYRRGDYGLQIERIAYPEGGEPEVLVQNAFWPRISPDGTRLAYVDATLPIDQVAVANIDGTDPQIIVPDKLFAALDAVTWHPDGTSILFSAISYGPTSEDSLLSRLFGVQVAYAHDSPSDIWQMPLSGGDPVQITDVQDFGLYIDYAPDLEYVALLRGSGIYLMKPDGSEMQRLLPPGPTGSVSWIP